MAGTSMVWPLFVALAAALTGDAAITARLAGDMVYNTTAPKDAPLDYIVLAGPTESEYWLFVNGGSTASLMLHAFCRGQDNGRALALYGEVHRVLNRASLVVDGFGGVTGELRLIDAQPDADGLSTHLVARYEVIGVRT